VGIFRGCAGFDFSPLLVASINIWPGSLCTFLFMMIEAVAGISIGLIFTSVSPQTILNIIAFFIFLITSILLDGVTYNGKLTNVKFNTHRIFAVFFMA
jgi:hypothetical protein